MAQHPRIIPAAEWARMAHHERDLLLKGGHLPGIAGGDPEGDTDTDGGDTGQGADDKTADDSDDESDDDDSDASGDSTGDQDNREPDWKREARKHERRAKQERKAREALEQQLRERETAEQSEHEKAIATAREEAASKVRAEVEAERRADRLELAVTRLAARGINVGAGDKQQTIRFADPEDVLLWVQRAIASEEIDADDVFDENGKVQADGLTTELARLAELKPHWLEANGNGRVRAAGSADAGKGKSGARDLDDMSPEDHLKAIQSRR